MKQKKFQPHVVDGVEPKLDKFLKTQNKEDETVFVCRSGARSGRATLQGRAMGFLKCVNLKGGMLLWNQKKFPIEGVR